jgi:hypothetical protein
LFQFAKILIVKNISEGVGIFFTDRGGFNCSAYQYPRRVIIVTVAGKKKRYELFFFIGCSEILKTKAQK